MLSAFANCLKIPELRQRIVFTVGLIFCCRFVETVPTPGVDAAVLQQAIASAQSKGGGGLIAFLDLFSGGALGHCAVGALGIMPYISASIILQLMTAIVPALERLAREGDPGRQKLNQYTRYLSIAICVIQGSFLALSLQNPGRTLGIDQQIVMSPGPGFVLLTILTLTTGTMMIMWLGDQITEHGVGNGISLVITVNIVSRMPAAIAQAGNMFVGRGGPAPFGIFHLIGFAGLMFLVVAGTIMLTQGQRRIPIHTAKRVVGRKVYGGQNTYMPLRVNYSGVMPLIFASVMIQFPAALLRMTPWGWLRQIGTAFTSETSVYMAAYGGMILFFSYFWVATQFNPVQIADDLRRNGAYVPGIRPGTPTAEFLDKTMTRVTLVGAVFLTVIAVIPTLLNRRLDLPWLAASFFGGTSLLIVVGVILDTMKQVESFLLVRHYDGFLTKGRLHGRR